MEAVILKGIIGVIAAVVDSFWATPDCVKVTLEGSKVVHVRALSDSSAIFGSFRNKGPPICYSPYYWDPSKGTPNFEKPPFWPTLAASKALHISPLALSSQGRMQCAPCTSVPSSLGC